MLICHCRAVNDQAIRRAVAVGGAASPDAVAAICGAGARCGGCLPALQAVLDDLAPTVAVRQTSAA